MPSSQNSTRITEKKSFFVVFFIFLSLTIPVFLLIFKNLTFFMYLPSFYERLGPVHPIKGGESFFKEKDNNFLLFNVSPTFPLLFWRYITYDHYDGFKWCKTTIFHLDPLQAPCNTTKVFTVELNSTKREIYLPIPSPTSVVFNFTLSPDVKFEVFSDKISSIYKIRISEPIPHLKITYQVTWNYANIHEDAISMDDIPEYIRKTYLQLPQTLPVEVKILAESLKNTSLTVLDQVLKDVEYFVNNFEYDSEIQTKGFIERDWVLTFLKKRKGICMDAATALTIILRCQGIPARVCCGFKPREKVGHKVLYSASEAHALTEVYLPPYGWVPFDATPAGGLDSLQEDFSSVNLDKRGPPIYLLRMIRGNVLFRNETNYIEGTIITNKDETFNGCITISLDGLTIAETNVKPDGSFFHPLYIPPDEKLGKHLLTLNMQSKNLTLKQKVRIIARTSMTAIIKKEGFLGNFLHVTIYLHDDQGDPISGQIVSIENQGLSGKTDTEGKLELSIDLPSAISPDSALLIISFNGSDQFSSATIRTQISREPNILVFPFIFSGLLFAVYKEESIRKFLAQVLWKKDKIKTSTKALRTQFRGIEKRFRLNIEFPEISDSLPRVWGIGDKLLIKCVWKNNARTFSCNKLKIIVDDTSILEREVHEKQYFTVSHTFESKGTHRIVATVYNEASKPLGITEVEIRIVDYREEIIELYHTFLQNLIRSNIIIRESMTPREIEYMLQQIATASPNVTYIRECFEEAEYSQHPIDRKNYKKIYLAIKKLKLEVN